MESQAFMWLQSLKTYFLFIFFFFTTSFSLFSLLIFFLRVKLWCNCNICHTYLTSSWSTQFNNLCDWYAHILKQSPSGTIHIHVLNNTITANPDNVEYILKTRFDNYPKGKPFSSILGDLLGNGIFNVDGDSWKFQRKIANLELGSLSIRLYAFEIVNDEIHYKLFPLLSSTAIKENCILDLQEIFRKFTFDFICRFSFGLDPESLEFSIPMSNFIVAFDLASKLSAERGLSVSAVIWKMKKFLNLGTEKKLKEAIKMVNELAEEVIQHKRKMGFINNQDLLSRFMCSVNDDKYLRDIVISFLLAGRDTVASALTSFFWLLGNYPEVESAILEELDLVMGLSQISFEDMRKLHYLQAALHESMRLYPPVQFDSKFSQEDDVLPDGMFVKKGTRVTYHPYAMGRMEEVWGLDCREFKPERWLKNGVFSPENPFKYPVFQAGVRVCLGKELALIEMKSVVLSVIKQFKIEFVELRSEPKFVPGLTATVGGGLPVMIRKRITR